MGVLAGPFGPCNGQGHTGIAAAEIICLMAVPFEPKTSILPKAQQEIWPLLAPAEGLSFVLYGGTAVALHLGHRVSVDFDFFRSLPLDKKELETFLPFLANAQTTQEEPNTLVVNVPM